jgi:hypothetical protein
VFGFSQDLKGDELNVRLLVVHCPLLVNKTLHLLGLQRGMDHKTPSNLKQEKTYEIMEQ